MSQRISVVACHYRQSHLAKTFWKGVTDNLPDVGEVIVVNDGPWSKEEADEVLGLAPTGFRPVTLLDHPKRAHGVGESFNIGVRAALNDLVYTLAFDMAPLPGTLAAHRSALKPGRITLGPLWNYDDPQHPEEATCGDPYIERMVSALNGVTPWRFGRNGNVLFYREDFLKVGGFNEELGRIGYGAEDLELFVRWAKVYGLRFCTYVDAPCLHLANQVLWGTETPKKGLEVHPPPYLESLGDFFKHRYVLFSEYDTKQFGPYVYVAHCPRVVSSSRPGKTTTLGDVLRDCLLPHWLPIANEVRSYVPNEFCLDPLAHALVVLERLDPGGALHLLGVKSPSVVSGWPLPPNVETTMEAGHVVLEKEDE